MNTPKYDSSALPYCCLKFASHIAYTHWVTFQMQSIVHCILCSYKHLSIHNSHIFSVFLSPLLFPTNWFVCSATKCSAICRTFYSSSLSRYMCSANADSKFVRLVQGGEGGRMEGGMLGFLLAANDPNSVRSIKRRWTSIRTARNRLLGGIASESLSIGWQHPRQWRVKDAEQAIQPTAKCRGGH